MKITIDKAKAGELNIELVHDPKKAPIAFALNDEKLDALLALINTARRLDRMYFSLEI